jgi:hypothetical protein
MRKSHQKLEKGAPGRFDPSKRQYFLHATFIASGFPAYTPFFEP